MIKVVITGGAGLVGQNLIARLREKPEFEIVAIDKNAHNSAILAEQHPSVKIIVADVANSGDWEHHLDGCDALVSCHAQIGGLDKEEFVRNNIDASRRLVEAAVTRRVPYLVNISSSVVNSMAVDNYTETKKAQEKLVEACGIPQVILRPTLMFGWFDRKHLGWLARFMQKSPVFPVPGAGHYLRQPLYVGDFCDLIIASIERRMTGAYNITGQERTTYRDLIARIKTVTKSKAVILSIPYSVFWILLWVYSIFDKNPPFTTKQLEALVTPDVFEVIDWPGQFGVRATPLSEALAETFGHPVYSKIAVQF